VPADSVHQPCAVVQAKRESDVAGLAQRLPAGGRTTALSRGPARGWQFWPRPPSQPAGARLVRLPDRSSFRQQVIAPLRGDGLRSRWVHVVSSSIAARGPVPFRPVGAGHLDNERQ
jgi:hypothetical protein